jgi:hypothetical protein
VENYYRERVVGKEMTAKKRVNLKILDRISQHELSYIVEGLRKLEEFEFRVSAEIEISE